MNNVEADLLPPAINLFNNFQPQKTFYEIVTQVFDHMELAYESLREDLYPNDTTLGM